MRKYALLALWALLPPFLSAARLTLSDGSTIEGHLVSATPPAASGSADRTDTSGARSDLLVLPAAGSISLRVTEEIQPAHAAEGRTFAATTMQDVMDGNGKIAVPRGAPATLVVRRLNGGNLALDLDSVTVNGARYARSRDGGNGPALGTLVDAIACDKEGAATGVVPPAPVVVQGAEIRVQADTLLNFRPERPIELWAAP